MQGYSQGSVSDLETAVRDSINGAVGADEMPDIFSSYVPHPVSDCLSSRNKHGLHQGRPLWSLNLPAKRENYYVPMVKGYFAAYGSFRSDDVKTGDLLAYTGSTASAMYFPNQVEQDDLSYAIDYIVMPAPVFQAPSMVSKSSSVTPVCAAKGSQSVLLIIMISVHLAVGNILKVPSAAIRPSSM